jgi:hypothetical protein
MHVNADIPPFLTYARSEFLYELREGFGYFTPITVFAVSSLVNEPIRFQIMADDKVHVKNIPIHALSNSKTAPKIEEVDCLWASCPDNEVDVIQYEYMATVGICGVWKKDGAFWQTGNYVLTLEWIKTKTTMHLIELNDGNYVLWAPEHLTWGEEQPKELPKYV